MDEDAAFAVKFIVGGCLALWLAVVLALWSVAAIIRWAVS